MEKSGVDLQFDGEAVVSCNFWLDHVGQVVLTLNPNGLSWKLIDSRSKDASPVVAHTQMKLVKPLEKLKDVSSCLGAKLISKTELEINFSDVYAVEFIDWGLIHESTLPAAKTCLPGPVSEMYRFTVHGVHRSKARPSLWVPVSYTFGHKDLQACQVWVHQINSSLDLEARRPKNLLVFVHPRSGKGNGCRTWESVAPIFSCAKVKTKVIVTERAGHAFDMMASITNRELASFDGVVSVGGDGFFNEILNGLLSSRHKAPYPPAPTDIVHTNGNDDNVFTCDSNDIAGETSHQNEDSPLLPSSSDYRPRFSNSRGEDSTSNTDQDPEFPIPNERFRFGIIPSGSTDAIVICTTGARDPITSALHIVLGKSVTLDIAQIVRWKETTMSKDEPCVRYAASFTGYGFYGDVITESEKYRWMGPKRYDYAGTKVFLRHRSYEAEIAYIEDKSEKTSPGPPKKSERVICRVNCNICKTKTPYSHPKESIWLKSKGRFLSVGAAVISCRNGKAPDGLVADAHLSDGFLHLILIKDCPHAFYLWHLTQLTKKGGNPLKFEFVEHHKTRAFTFTSSGNESVWNLDGEIFPAHQLSAQVFRGLVSLFASGPEV